MNDKEKRINLEMLDWIEKHFKEQLELIREYYQIENGYSLKECNISDWEIKNTIHLMRLVCEKYCSLTYDEFGKNMSFGFFNTEYETKGLAEYAELKKQLGRTKWYTYKTDS